MMDHNQMKEKTEKCLEDRRFVVEKIPNNGSWHQIKISVQISAQSSQMKMTPASTLDDILNKNRLQNFSQRRVKQMPP